MGENKKQILKTSDFVHLHNHTHYSLLDGLTKIPALMDLVSSEGMTAVAMTDHGTLSGTVEFYKQATAKSIKPIIGMEAYVATRTINDRDATKDKQYYHLIVIAMNNIGYQNLMQLSTIANLEGLYYKPRIDHELLKKYNEGLIILSGCIGGEVGDQLRQGQEEKAKETAKWYKSVFKDRYFIEIQDHGHPLHPSRWDEQVRVNEMLLKLAKEQDIPAVVTSDSHYLNHEDQEAHEILLCVQTGAFLNDTKRMSLKEFELQVAGADEIINRWGATHPELILNTSKIAERCNLTFELGKILIPNFPTPKGDNEKSYLNKMTFKGLAWRYGGYSEDSSKSLNLTDAKKSLPKEVLQRAEYELGIIESMGFSGYFLIISDFINWGKDLGIVFGPGRGSAAGSIIAYGLKITELDPLKYDLLFERFLNPDRISMPDIDIDIQDNRRDEVIQYCVQKYGKERVANIVTFGTMAARAAVRDVARVLQVPYSEADVLAKLVPPPVQGRHILLSKSIKENAELKAAYDSGPIAKRVFDLAVQLEGTIRSHGVHAAGVVIAPDDIVKYAPLEMAQKGVVTTQYAMGPIEDLGLLKMDFLGLSNLTTIKNALRIIKRVHGVEININSVPLDDKKTYKLLQKGDTTGVFQLESAGMKRYLKDLVPSEFDDIIAMVALYRPGPMQWIEDFVARKHGKHNISFIHPSMKLALKNTYGIIVYQEQVMQISKDMCGFTGGQADTLRKAIGKKKPEELAKLKTAFIEGAIKTVKADIGAMEKFWSQLEAFAAYAFPKAHAACYALTAYHTAYLKANYPASFMAALMSSDFDDLDRLNIEISECKHLGIEVLPPDINESFVEFAVVPQKNKIRFGMAAVKNVGISAVEEILRARQVLGGNFANLEQYVQNVSPKTVNRKALESLVKAGAFDRFGERNHLLSNIDLLLKYSDKFQKEVASGQTDLFSSLGPLETVSAKLILDKNNLNFTQREHLSWERELLGLYLSKHPLEYYQIFLSEKGMPLDQLTSSMEGKSVTIGGAISDVRTIMTKNGSKMAFVKIADMKVELECIVFPKVFVQNTQIWERDQIIIISGKVNSRDRDGNESTEVKILVESARIISLEEVKAYKSTGKTKKLPKAIASVQNSNSSLDFKKLPKIYLRIVDSDNQNALQKIKEIIDKNIGVDTEVVLVLGPNDDKQVIKLPQKINSQSDAEVEFQNLLGKDMAKVK